MKSLSAAAMRIVLCVVVDLSPSLSPAQTSPFPVVSNTAELVDLTLAAFTNPYPSKAIPAGLHFQTDIGPMALSDLFLSSFTSQLVAVSNVVTWYPLVMQESSNTSPRQRLFVNANGAVAYSNNADGWSPQEWVDATYGPAPDYLDNYYEDLDPARQTIAMQLCSTSDAALYYSAMTNLHTCGLEGTNSVINLYDWDADCVQLVLAAPGAEASLVSLFVHTPATVEVADVYRVTDLVLGAWTPLTSLRCDTGNASHLTSLPLASVDGSGNYRAADASLDSDGDGLPDSREQWRYGTCATNADGDADDLNDWYETMRFMTDPHNADTDGDGHTDGWEARRGFNPTTNEYVGLVGWWLLDETRGTFIEDSSGNANHGRLHGNSASHGAVGPSVWALHFDGNEDSDGESDWIQIPDSVSLDIATNITLAVWVWLDITNDYRGVFFEKVGAYYLNTKNGRLYFSLSGVADDMTAPVSLATQQWIHVAASYDGTNVGLYVNGQQRTNRLATGGIATTANPLWLGLRAGSPQRYLPGRLDDARIYARALSSDEVWALYKLGRDVDGDGLGYMAECYYGGNPILADRDGDGFTDFAEAVVYGTDPGVANARASISGTNIYVGAGTGRLMTVASHGKFNWPTNSSTWRWTDATPSFRTNTGDFTITDVPVGTNYFVKSFLDLNGNGQYDPNEPGSMPLSSYLLTTVGVQNLIVPVEKVRGLRVDLAYESCTDGPSTTSAVERVVSNAAAWGVNTLYPFAWSYEYGTYWKTTNADLKMTTAGSHDALRIMADQAHARGIKVIAWIQPANSFTNAWANHADWRARQVDGSTYSYPDESKPIEYLLSPFNTNYVNWFAGVVGEVLDTGVDGVDISETTVDPTVSTNLTYDAAATNLYWQRYPSGQLGDENWKLLRAEVLTSNIFQRVGGVVHAYSGRYFHVTFSWHAEKDTGSLEPIQVETRDSTGFDLHDIVDLPASARPDAFNVEFLWQNYQNTNIFNPAWVTFAATSFTARMRGRTPVVTHVELMPGDYQPVTTNAFEASLRHALTNSMGGDFYDYHQAVVTNAGLSVSNVYSGVP